MRRDELFVATDGAIGDFDFGDDTAEVFDDMLERSIAQNFCGFVGVKAP